MKKIPVLFIVLILCGTPAVFTEQGYSKVYDKIVIKALAYGDASNQEGQEWIRIVDAFEKENPGIKIEYELLYSEAYHQKIAVRLASGDIPHLAFMVAGTRWGTPWRDAGLLFDHRPYIDPDYYDISLIPGMGPDGEIYMIPNGTSIITTVLYMNEKLVKSLGFSAPGTYADIAGMVPAARAAGIDVITINGADGWAWGSCLLSIIIARLSGDEHWVSKAVKGNYTFTDRVFVDSLDMLNRMVRDGVISDKSVLVDYGANLSIFNQEKALFMIQGSWAAGSIDTGVAQYTSMLPWPQFPGERSNMAGSVAAVMSVGYGITRAGADQPDVRNAAFRFLKYFHSFPETTRRLRDGFIVAPILKNFPIPDDLPDIVKKRVKLARSAKVTDVIDVFLSGAPNDALNTGIQKIVSGTATPERIVHRLEDLLAR